MVAGHSLGEFSAIVAAQAISFEDGLSLVMARANAMQIACQQQDSTMAAIIGIEASLIEEVFAIMQVELLLLLITTHQIN